MSKTKTGVTFAYVGALLLSPVGVLWCLKNCYLLGFAAYHGVRGAARGLLLFRCLAVAFALVFLGAGVGLIRELVMRRRFRYREYVSGRS
jgi:hypothetical protein